MAKISTHIEHQVVNMLKILYKIITCHMLGDYVLQTDFLAQTKGKNWYNLIVHCVLYTLPFAFAFGFDIVKISILFVTHIIIDAAKARYHKVNYATDQILHYLISIMLYM